MISDEKWVYTSCGYGKVLEEQNSKVIVELCCGGTAYLNPSSVSTSIPISIKHFTQARKTLHFDWDIRQNFSSLFKQLPSQLSLPVNMQAKLFLTRARLVQISPCDSPMSLRLKKDTKFVCIVRQSFTWDVGKKSDRIEVLDDSVTIRKKDESEIHYDSIFANVEMGQGNFEWDIQMDFLMQYEEEEEVFVGVATQAFNVEASPLDGEFWGIMCIGCIKVGNGTNEEFGERFSTGDVLTVKLQFKGTKGTLAFDKNGNDLGVAWTDVPQGVYPIITLNYPKMQVSLGKVLGM